MSEPIDHYAKAQEMAVRAEDHLLHVFGKTEEATAYTRLGQLHLDIHATSPQIAVDTDEGYWELAGQLEELTGAVKTWFAASAGRVLIGDPFAQRVAELIDYRAPEA
jgi:hypothetical protein